MSLGESLGEGLGASLGASLSGGPLLSWNAGTFANASSRFIWDASGKILHGAFPGGEPAVATIGGKRRLQIEGARTNRLNVVSAWTIIGGNIIRTSGQSDPSGGTGASLIEHLGEIATDRIQSANVAGTVAAFVGVGVFVKRKDSSATWDMRSLNTLLEGQWDIDNSLLSDGWERLTADHPAVTVNNPFKNAGSGAISIMFSDPGGDTDIDLWFPQVSNDLFVSSPILEATTRAADSMTFTAGQTPEVIRSGRWSTEVTLEFQASDLANNDQHFLYHWDASNFLVIEKTAGGVYQVRLATTGGDLTRTITNSRDQTLKLTQDLGVGALTVEGATTGDGTDTGTVTALPSSTLNLGGDGGSGSEAFCLISEPRAA